MRVLVTGAAGYVGSICAEVCRDAGHQVIGFDNLSEGHREAVPEGVEFVHGDLAEPKCIEEALQARQPEAVMHFAAASLVGESMRELGKYVHANVGCTTNLLEAMRKFEVPQLIYSSTAAVYGHPDSIPITEDHPLRPANFYGQTKWMCEQLFPWYAERFGLSSVSLRYFNAAGASEALGEDHRNETHIIPILLAVALGQRPDFEIFGNDYETQDGACIRDYVDVRDIAGAHLLALENMDGAACQVFNIGTGCGHSVREIVAAVRSVTGKEIPTRDSPRREGDPAVLVASYERIGEALGWIPRRSLEESVEAAWKWKQAYPAGYGGGR